MKVERLKICPRCGGNMFLDREEDGYYEECLQCSYSRALSGITVESKVGSARAEEKSPIVEEYEDSPGRSRSKYTWVRHEPISSPDIANDSGHGESIEPSQDWEHPPTKILEKLQKVGAKLLHFSSE